MLFLRLPCEQTIDSLCHLFFLPLGSVALGESQLPCLKNSYRALCRSPCGKHPRRPNRAREKWGPLTAVLGLNSLASWFSCPAKPSDRQEIRLLSGKEGCECSLVVVFHLQGQLRTLLRKPYWWELNHPFTKFTNVKALETSTAHNFRVGTMCLLVSLVLDEISCCWWEWKEGKLKLLHFFLFTFL